MRKSCLAVVMILIFATSAMGNRYMKNSPLGFRGVKWGDPPSALGDRMQISKNIYVRIGDEMNIGGAKLTAILYVFWDERFLGVNVYADKGQFLALLNALIAQFGKPMKPDKYDEEYVWQDSNAVVVVAEVLGEGGELLILSQKIIDLQKSKLRYQPQRPSGF